MSPSPARGHQGCGRPPTHLVDDPLHQVELPLQGGVKEKRQWVEADPQPVPRPLRVGLLQVGPFALSGGSFGFQGDPMEAGPGAEGRAESPRQSFTRSPEWCRAPRASPLSGQPSLAPEGVSASGAGLHHGHPREAASGGGGHSRAQLLPPCQP